jgi:FkbM family methyltransferase
MPGGRKRPFYFRSSSEADKGVIQQVFVRRDYDLARQALQRPLKDYLDSIPKDVCLLVIDAGAHIGASVVYFTSLDPRIHVCAIEPERRNFALLSKNCEGLPVTLIEGAVAGEAGELWLQDPKMGEWGYRVQSGSGLYKVRTHTIDDILNRFSVEKFRPLMCKLDVEGAEKFLFDSDSWMDRVPLTIIELHDWMLPGQFSSQGFLRAVAKRSVDFLIGGENIFVLNYDSMKR